MTRPLCSIVLLVSCGLALAACKKGDDPQAIPVPSASVAIAPTPTETAAPTATVSAAPTPPPPPPVVQQAPIDGCCSALSAASSSAKSKGDKDKLSQAAKICTGIAAKVKTGASQRSSALTTIRSQLGSLPVPGECH